MRPPPPTDVPKIDLTKPNAARMYDYHLGGAHNFEPDRLLATQVEQVAPWVKDVARINRAWLHRVLDFLMSQGIRQFLDLGSGIPTVGNVHEIAQRADPSARVVYVDYEPVAVHHSYELLKDNENAAIVWADVSDPRAVLEHPEVSAADRLLRAGRAADRRAAAVHRRRRRPRGARGAATGRRARRAATWRSRR